MQPGFEQLKYKGGKLIAVLSFLTLSALIPLQAMAQDCPQERKTQKAPAKFIKMENPLPADAANIKAGADLFNKKAKPIACKTCHGVKGDGKGDADFESTPPARIFTCNKTMEALPDGQLFWIIKNGSKNTSMFSFASLSDNQVWQLIHYIRQFAK
jgi:mono/diheme cytochrome c family protein